MAKIGCFGNDIVFKTSSKQVLTFSDFTQDVNARWVEHEIIGKKSKSEFVGADLREISFSIELDISLGVKPRKQLEKLEKLVEHGVVNKLIIGGKKIGKNKWKITGISESWDNILNKGELVSAKVKLSLKEYV